MDKKNKLEVKRKARKAVYQTNENQRKIELIMLVKLEFINVKCFRLRINYLRNVKCFGVTISYLRKLIRMMLENIV